MRKIDFIVTEENISPNVGIFLKYKQGLSTRTIKALKLTETGITLNGKHIRTIDTIKVGDIISVEIEDNPKEYIKSDTYVPVLYEDEDVVVFNKPFGMPSHQTKKHQTDTLGNVFATYCEKNNLKISFRPINRLDTDTTGAVMIAKNSFSAYKLSKTMDKTYVGIISGCPKEKIGTVEANIDRVDEIGIRRYVSENSGQYAKTDYEVISTNGKFSFVKFKLHTGRTHQIRVHMSYLGYPLVGDPLYGGDMSVFNTQALHCAKLIFPQPVSDKIIAVKAPLPKNLKEFMEKHNLSSEF